jgi:hypothetical protein
MQFIPVNITIISILFSLFYYVALLHDIIQIKINLERERERDSLLIAYNYLVLRLLIWQDYFLFFFQFYLL